MLKILLCSGAPAAGKDTVGDFLRAKHHEKFAKPLREAVKAFHGWSDETLDWQKRTDDKTRKVQIGLSEVVVKPIYGPDYFGLACADRIQREWSRHGGDLSVVITDAGFQAELDAFCERVREFEPEAKFELWQIRRPFCGYEGDSRGPVELQERYGRTIEVENAQDLNEFYNQVIALAGEFFN
jgi:hypothetical protein